MANLKEIRSRISSVSSTMKITSAMKMVSAAKLKKSQDRLQSIIPYSSALKKSINNVLPSINSSEIMLLSSFCETDRVLIIAISSNRGLCGGFNANIFKKVQKLITDKTDFFCIGKKGAEAFSRVSKSIIKKETEILDQPSVKSCREVSETIIKDFTNGKWSKVLVVYNKFKNAATQTVELEQILPIVLDEPSDSQEAVNSNLKDYIFEPDKKEIINSLIPEKIHTQLFEAILNSIAAEHGARMTAMHKATDNAQDLKDGLTLSYNRQRQAAITNEILEIVAGAEALKSS